VRRKGERCVWKREERICEEEGGKDMRGRRREGYVRRNDGDVSEVRSINSVSQTT
jgi:hypothetical protein